MSHSKLIHLTSTISPALSPAFATLALTLSLSLLTGCQNSKNGTSEVLDVGNGVKALSAIPKEKATDLDALKRFVGQTSFLTASSYMGRGMPESARSAAPSSGVEKSAGGDRREVQESDVFKVAPDKMLFLLNSYRGLQAIDFKKGADQGELVGRIFPESSGNFREMYLDSKSKTVYLLATNYSPATVEVSSFDISNPSQMKAVSRLKVNGSLSDSRLVGNILYLATRTYEENESGVNKSAGIVTSVRLDSSKVEQVQQVKLALSPDYDESMNIVEVEKEGKYRYYLLAHLADSGWGLGRKSAVEVVDISSSEGKILSLMTAYTSGSIVRRNSSQIKDNTLIVVTNYFTGKEQAQSANEQAQRRLRVAVETFQLPTNKSQFINEKEEKARKARLEYEDHRLSTENLDAEEVIKRTESLLKNKEYGLSGIFVKTETGNRKLIADARETVGSPDGQHAQIQDVRWNGNHLYVFWVPTNQIDPFELFDLSNVAVKAKHIARLQFDGWIAKAIPVSFKGRELVIGLGWIVPAVNNETNRRQMQAKIFEVKRSSTKASIGELATLTIDSAKYWANFQSGDKFIETNFKSANQGEILFEASTYDSSKGYKDGGKLVLFDLEAAINGQEDKALQDGAFLVGEGSWLKRIFTNPEINRVQSFSNEALNTFAEVQGAGTVQAIQSLELARNIVAYEVTGSSGIQVISKDNYSYEAEVTKQGGKVSLRLVNGKNADAELKQTLSQLEIQGGYLGHLKMGSDLVVVTRESIDNWKAGTESSTHRLSLVRVSANGQLTLADQKEISRSSNRNDQAAEEKEEKKNAASSLGRIFQRSYGRSVLMQIDDQVLLSVGQKLYNLKVDQKLSLTTMDQLSCTIPAEANVELKQLENKNLVFVQESVALSAAPFNSEGSRSQVQKNSMMELTVKDGKIACGQSVNIPGEPILVTDTHIISQDTEYKGFEVNEYKEKLQKGQETIKKYYQVKTESALTVLERKANQAVLTDSRQDKMVGSLELIHGALLRKKESERQSFGIRPWRGGMRPSRGDFSEGPQNVEFEWLSVDQGRLVSASEWISLQGSNSGSEGRIASKLSLGKERMILLLTSYSGPAQLLEVQGRSLKPMGQVFLPGYSQKLSYDSKENTLLVAAGLYGVFQIQLK